MAFVLVRHKVKDYPKWKQIFDAALFLRQSSGEKSCKIFRNSDDPNEVVVLTEWDDIHNAVKYSQNKLFRQAAEVAGIVTKPVVYVPEEGLGL